MDVVINLDKPKGITSQEAVTKVKRIFGVKKAGHAGTLDPIATGVLLVCLGEATKITRFLADMDKEYVARVKLGEKTDTLDSEGTIIFKATNVSLDRADVERVIRKFIGVIHQTPPMFSAIKIGGKPLYKLARKGMEIERPERIVNVREIEIMGFEPPWLEIRVSCSKGTYIRTLCDDIGEELGVGAHITELKRTRIGAFAAGDSATLEDLEGISPGKAFPVSLPAVCEVDFALRHLDEIVLSEPEFRRARNGLPVVLPGAEFSPHKFMRLKAPSGIIFAVGRGERNVIKIERMLHIGE